jgi:hypothetical protein
MFRASIFQDLEKLSSKLFRNVEFYESTLQYIPEDTNIYQNLLQSTHPRMCRWLLYFRWNVGTKYPENIYKPTFKRNLVSAVSLNVAR